MTDPQVKRVLRPELVELGNRVRRARYASSMTQAELSDRTGLSRVALSNIELGVKEVGVLKLRRLAAALNVSVGQLVD
ncbi:Helix-turn-helix [Microlunatus sagamiharensis]|uniref:Helix-turn-helix n=1 Tax=Microlunatus sagamiharensis TaxID=546874 RepID=A0A1H2N5P5_9ACTN|nr:helix-turn-helix transcriptional regulator [Microlunatus sagamiharensis]SDV00869.1 Helix-turn-helix [Microlunatus sagamiharensis]